jgi:hypothetical protein
LSSPVRAPKGQKWVFPRAVFGGPGPEG